MAAWWTPLALGALLVGGWLITIPIADQHGTDEPFPWTAFPMYSRVPSPRASFNVLLVPMGANASAMVRPEQAFDARQDLRFGPARGALETIRQSWLHGCPGLRTAGFSGCTGNPDDFRMPPPLARQFARAVSGRLGLASDPDLLVFATERPYLDPGRRAEHPQDVVWLFTFDTRTGEVVHG